MKEAEQARIWREAMAAREEMEQAADEAGYWFVLGAGGRRPSQSRRYQQIIAHDILGQ
jgi:hypothetical protein